MENITQKAYHVFWALFGMFFIAMLIFFDLNVEGKAVKGGYETVTEYEVVSYTDRSAPIGIRQEYSFELDGVEESYCYLMIYTIHQNIEIFIDEQSVYSMEADQVDMSGMSPGCLWNQVSFEQQDNGKMVRIEIMPVYESSVDIVPTFYFGSRADIIRDVFMRGLPVIILSLVTIAIGFIYIAFIFYHYKSSEVEANLLMLGHFAVQIGLWKLTDTEALTLLVEGHPVLSQVPFMSLMLACVSITLFIKDLYSTREHKIWYALVIYGFVVMGMSLLLQGLGIADMRQILPLIHVNIVLIFVVSVIMAIYEVRTVGWNTKLKRSILCMATCFVGAGIDMVIYYVSKGQFSTVSGLLGFMIYIFVMGFGSIEEIKKLMDIGIEAQRYEKMAYHDQLTGLYNRTAFAEHTDDADFVAEKSIIIVMDLNNLKMCNDKLGHDKGDIYIKECARIIRESFEDIGRCYRMGGDEFYVLLTNADLHLCKQRLQVLKERVAKCDKIEGFHMGIACGYKRYDRLLDYDIHETARRADKVMYQEKFAMKEL